MFFITFFILNMKKKEYEIISKFKMNRFNFKK